MPEVMNAWRHRVSEGLIGLSEVDGAHPFRRLYGVDQQLRAQFAVLVDEQPSVPSFSHLVAVERGRRQDGRWTLVLTLLDGRFLEVFLRLCDDLIRRTDEASDSAEGVSLILAGVEDWRRVLNPKPVSRLSEEKLRDVIAATWTAAHKLRPQWSASQATAAWLRPFGTPQDFVFEGVGSYVVRGVKPNAIDIRIRSERTLDRNENPLKLALINLHDPDQNSDQVVSLSGLAGDLRSAVLAEGGDPADVDTRYKMLGIDLGDPYYQERTFEVGTVEVFDATEDFPCIRASTPPLGVFSVEYRIRRSALSPFASPNIAFN